MSLNKQAMTEYYLDQLTKTKAPLVKFAITNILLLIAAYTQDEDA